MKKLLVFAALVSLVTGFVFSEQTGGITNTLVTFKGQRVILYEKSYALSIGVSKNKYWPDRENIPDERKPLESGLEKEKENENPFGKEINRKAKRIYKNEKGFWEADYGDGIVMVYIPPGEFTMGANDYSDEKPIHTVYLDGYWIGKYEVTFAQYDKYCEEREKEQPGDRGWERGNRPVIKVSWDDAGEYCDWLSTGTGLSFKLPTEAQWEKAARGTGGRKYPWGDDFPRGDSANFADKQSSISWADENIDDGYTYTAPVGSYPRGASPYGVHDMAGNVWEWCSDWYDSDYYKKSPHKNPRGPETGSIHVVRGGSWGSDAGELRSADRRGGRSFDRDVDLGFRLCQENK